MRRRAWALLEMLAFSSLWIGIVAAALCAAAGAALGAAPEPGTLLLAAAGTLVVYNVDRLRDLDRDRHSSPRRSAFVDANRARLVALTAGSGLLAAALALPAGPPVWVLLAPVAGLGLLHRRLKHSEAWKPVYVAAAWTAVAVGLPAASAAGRIAPERLAWAGGIVALTAAANVIGSSLRDREAPAAPPAWGGSLGLARALAGGGILVGLAAPGPLAALALLPLATWVALLSFHPGELYALLVLDGAVLLGALGALVLV